MVATDDHGCRHLSGSDEVVDPETSLRAVAVAEPADPRRQSLECHAFRRKIKPALEKAVVREKTPQRPVDRCDVLRIARQHCPTEGTDAAAEERSDIGRDKARI